jgi:hypothetical protein
VKLVAGRVTDSRAKPSTPSPGTSWKSDGHMAARQPLREEGGDHGIAHGKFRHAAPTAVTRPAPSAMGMRPSAAAPGRRDQQVVVVERAGVNAYLDLAGGGGSGGQLDKLQCSKPPGAAVAWLSWQSLGEK